LLEVPDFGLIPQGKHFFYIITLRDPLQRSISAFVYEHLDNVKARGESISPLAEEAKIEAKKCFPSLESFVEFIGDNPEDYDYPYHRSQIVAANCTSLARAVIDGKVRRFNHFFFPFQKVRDFIPTDHNPIIFATRQEHLWYDWKKINFLLGQVGDVITPPDDAKARDLSNVSQPVTRELSSLGKQRLCKALQKEYDGYVRILREAINLSDDDVQQSLHEIHQNCPYIIVQPPE
jgi:Sulfotransferase family